MNKTININLAGIIFYVDEVAFEHFSNYLKSVKSQFDNSEERTEIIADIEARIAELLQSKLSDSKQVVNLEDIESIIAIMGSPEDYALDDDDTTEKKKQTKTSQSESYNYRGPKKLFRNPDDKILSGVSSGIAAYFGIDAVWIRLIWIALFFGFGTGFIFYIILWAVMPEAKTTAQKLQMRGEPINISNIERSVKEEMKDVKEKFSNFSNRTSVKSTSQKIRYVLEDIISAILSIAKSIFGFVAKFIGVILMIFGVFIIIALIGLFFGWNTLHIDGIDWQNLTGYLNAIFPTGSYMFLFMIGLVMIVIAPIIGIILLSMRILFNYRTKNKVASFALIGVSVIGFIFLFTTLSFLGRSFASSATTTEIIDVSSADKNFYLQVDNFVDDERPYELDWTLTDKYQILTDIELDVKQTRKPEPYINISTSSNGTNRIEARKRAENREYFTDTKDSVLSFADYFLIPADEKYRFQEMDIVLYLPVGYSIYLDKSMGNIIYDIKNVTNTYDLDMLGYTWVMTQNGLACKDCEQGEIKWQSSEDWENTEEQFESEAQEYEQQKLEEVQRKLKEAEEELNRLKNKSSK